MVAIRDITKRKQAEKAIQEQLTFNKLLTDLLTRFAICSGDEIDAAIHVSLHKIVEFIGGL